MMIRRPAVTLMEVLIAMFIMAIGMMALMALFPVGAVSMYQALKDDRCASAASMAENVAIAQDLRHDPVVTQNLNASSVVYVDPYGANQGFTVVGTTALPRVTPNFITNTGNANVATIRWFSLPDGINFAIDGVPDTTNTGGFVDRDRRYTYAYLLRHLPMTNLVQMYVVVYAGRSTSVLSLERTDTAATVTTTNSVQLSLSEAQLNTTNTRVRIGGWIMDASGSFYRITNLTGNPMLLETQQNFPVSAVGATGSVVFMDDVAEVFDKGTGWLP